MVVVAILAVGSTIALYSYSSYRRTLSVNSTGRKAQAMMVTAKNLAINSGRPVQMVVNLDKETFWIDGLDRNGNLDKPKIYPEEQAAEFVLIERLRVGPDVFDSGIHSILFEPDGRNRFVVVTFRREFDDATVAENYTSIRLFPSSREPQFLERTRLE